MSNKSIFQKPHLKKDVNRSAFDISQKRVFHSPFGLLLPCFYKRVPANSYVEIQPESQFICDSIVRPAFIRLKEHIDYFAVPYSQLWHPFDNFVTSQDNYDSAAVEYYNSDQDGSGVVPGQVPLISASCLNRTFNEIKGKADIHGYNKAFNAARLLNLLDYLNPYKIVHDRLDVGTIVDYPELTETFDNAFNGLDDVNLFGLLAYQKVYYDFFRNPKYEKCITTAYNIDDLEARTYSDIQARMEVILEAHYAWAKKDYFTQVQPSILPTSSDIGFAGMQNLAPSSAFGMFGVPGASSSNSIASIEMFPHSVINPQNNTGNVVATNQNSFVDGRPINVTALRFAFAYDKLLRRMREAGGTFDKQMLAQFGITPFDQRNGKCFYIGGQTNRLNASDVTQVSGDGLGQLGSQINVYSTPRNTFKFKAQEECIIIGVYHTSLDFDYPSCNTSRENLSRYRFDWFNPQFQNLGLQPLYKMELNNLLSGDNGHGGDIYDPSHIDTVTNNRSLLGFVRRYSDYKTNIDKLYGLYDPYMNNVEKKAWVAPFTAKYFTLYTEDFPVAPLTQKTLTFNPAQFNSVVKNDYNGLWETDPFTNHLYTHCKLIANMSVDGEEF